MTFWIVVGAMLIGGLVGFVCGVAYGVREELDRQARWAQVIERRSRTHGSY